MSFIREYLREGAMEINSREKYEINESKERALWSNCFFVFDTSALLDFYYYPLETRKEIFEKILDQISDRLWIPNHVEYEFLKNRKSKFNKPIKEKYDPVREEIEQLKKLGSQIQNAHLKIQKDTKNPDKHPHLPQNHIDSFGVVIKEFDSELEDFSQKISDSIDIREAEIKSLEENDIILNYFEEVLAVGDEFSFTEIMEIVS